MGDLRNKLKKELRDEAHRRWMAKNYPPRTPSQIPRCLCGLTYYDVPIMWAAPGKRHEPQRFYCPACLPVDLLWVVAPSVANLPHEES